MNWKDFDCTCATFSAAQKKTTLQFLSGCCKNNINFKVIFRLDGIIICIRVFSMLQDKTQNWILHSPTTHSNSRFTCTATLPRSRDVQFSERWNKAISDSPDATSKLWFFRLKRKLIASPVPLSHFGRGSTWRPKTGWMWGCLGGLISVITFLCLVPACSTCHTRCQWLLILEAPSCFLL